jgi:Predicted pyridoxal phosphate-dependent enzyme apparently involved in regulation of cell wall biogenesis
MSERKRIYLCLAHMSDEGIEKKYIKEAFDTNWVVPLGPNVNGFEHDLEEFVNQNGKIEGLKNGNLSKRVVALSSGTSAVHLALIACGVGPGDEVLVQSFTFCASSHPITYLGATPVFVDSERDTWNMDPELLEEAIKDRIAKTGKKPKAIVPVALYGMPYKIDKIMEIADRYGIPVIEDAAEGFGSKFNGQVLGTFGKYGVLSFNGNKMITTSGGGALICNGASPQSSPKGKDLGVHTADPTMYGLLKEFAEENRSRPTEAESVLWEALKGNGLGEKFRRQHIIADFIVDFFCADKGLTIELDGGYHNNPPQMKSDAERTAVLSKLGYIELRFTNEEVLGDIDGVLQKISNFCNALPSKSHPSGGDSEGADTQWREIMMYATQYRESYPYYQHEKIGYNYRMSNICAGIGRGQMTIVNDHIAHHKHVQGLYEQLLQDVKGITVHKQPNDNLNHNHNNLVYDSNYWLCTITIDENVKVKGQENAYKTIVTGAVGGAAGVIHAAESATTDCQPNDNVEAMRVVLDAAGIEARPVWKPMHKQPVYCRTIENGKLRIENLPCGAVCQTSGTSVAYINGVSEALFKVGMCLPSGPYVTDDDVKYIVETIKNAIV